MLHRTSIDSLNWKWPHKLRYISHASALVNITKSKKIKHLYELMSCRSTLIIWSIDRHFCLGACTENSEPRPASQVKSLRQDEANLGAYYSMIIKKTPSYCRAFKSKF